MVYLPGITGGGGITNPVVAGSTNGVPKTYG
jgi:hypothetical protein